MILDLLLDVSVPSDSGIFLRQVLALLTQENSQNSNYVYMQLYKVQQELYVEMVANIKRP